LVRAGARGVAPDFVDPGRLGPPHRLASRRAVRGGVLPLAELFETLLQARQLPEERKKEHAWSEKGTR